MYALFSIISSDICRVGFIWGHKKYYLSQKIKHRSIFQVKGPNNSTAIVPFHKSQCALRYLDPMSKIQNTMQPTLSGHVTDCNGQWSEWRFASAYQPCECLASYWMTQRQHWSHIVHRPCPHGNLPLPCTVRNDVWYCVKYSSLKSFYML